MTLLIRYLNEFSLRRKGKSTNALSLLPFGENGGASNQVGKDRGESLILHKPVFMQVRKDGETV